MESPRTRVCDSMGTQTVFPRRVDVALRLKRWGEEAGTGREAVKKQTFKLPLSVPHRTKHLS